MNYTEAIDWLENIPISFDSNYDGYELKLVNIAKFLEQLGNPQNDLSLIHVGGTNGKGSTCHIISSILQLILERIFLYHRHEKLLNCFVKVQAHFLILFCFLKNQNQC